MCRILVRGCRTEILHTKRPASKPIGATRSASTAATITQFAVGRLIVPYPVDPDRVIVPRCRCNADTRGCRHAGRGR